jgi:hypothetical protein
MSMDGVVPPQSGPSRRPAGGPAKPSGADKHQEPMARRYGAQDGGAQSSGAQPSRPDHGTVPDTPPSDGPRSDNTEYLSLDNSASENDNTAFDDLTSALSSWPWHALAASSADQGYREFDDDDQISPAEASLTDALRTSVARVGLAGPPPDGLLRIQHKARTRQRNRAVLAGSAGVLLLAVAATLATGAHFDLVPSLTGASGASGGGASGAQTGTGSSSHPSAAANGGHEVWPTGSPGKIGLAIGPVAPVVATPPAAAAAQLPLCTAMSLKAATTVGATVSGVVYGRVDAIAQSSCVAVGPPVLTVANQAGTASSSITILKENPAAAPQLPSVPTWGRTMVLKAGQAYQFQFAWAATTCVQNSASPSPSTPNGQTATSMYYLGYAVTGTTPTAVITLNAPCGAQVYVTDIYSTGAFPLPKASTPPPPVTSTPAEPPSSPASPPASSAPPTSPSASPSPSASDSSDAPNGVLTSGQPTTPSG